MELFGCLLIMVADFLVAALGFWVLNSLGHGVARSFAGSF